MTATTALTVQNTKGVTDVHVIPADFVAKQIEAVVEDIRPDVIKTGVCILGSMLEKSTDFIGMLGSAETIVKLGELVQKHKIDKVVVDPVMVSTSGAQLLPHEAIAQLSKEILPYTTLLTPNIPEAKLLLSENGKEVPEINDVEGLEELAKRIMQLGPKWVLVKGGHIPFTKDFKVAKSDDDKKFVVDVLLGDEVRRVVSPWQESTSTHGTGCSLACKCLTRSQLIQS